MLAVWHFPRRGIPIRSVACEISPIRTALLSPDSTGDLECVVHGGAIEAAGRPANRQLGFLW